jgi:hypothetical protein
MRCFFDSHLIQRAIFYRQPALNIFMAVIPAALVAALVPAAPACPTAFYLPHKKISHAYCMHTSTDLIAALFPIF